MSAIANPIIAAIEGAGRPTMGDLITRLNASTVDQRKRVKADVAALVEAGHIVETKVLGVPVYTVPKQTAKPSNPETVSFAGMHGRLSDMISVTAFAAEGASMRLAELRAADPTPETLTEIQRVADLSEQALRLWSTLRWDVEQADAQGGGS